MSMTVKEMSEFIKMQETVMGLLLRVSALELILKEKGVLTDELFSVKIKEIGETVVTRTKEMMAAKELEAKNNEQVGATNI